VLGRYAEVHDKLVSGEIDVMAIDFTEWVATDAAKGAPVATAEVEPVIEVILVTAIPRLAEHANAAALLTGWLLSPEGQQFLDEAYTASPYHAGTKAAELLEGRPAVNMLELDVTGIAKNLDDILVRGTGN
jgi:ABC-type Fe3+ transport system substrate-binding protein